MMWWFFTFGAAIVTAKFPFDVYDHLSESGTERYQLLSDAMGEWAGRHRLEEATSALTLIARLENSSLIFD
jgi:hypothetical protein